MVGVLGLTPGRGDDRRAGRAGRRGRHPRAPSPGRRLPRHGREAHRPMTARGFSLLEMVITTAIVSVVAAGGFRLIDAAHRLSYVGEESSDMMQRFRVAGGTLQAALVRAGAGTANDVS